MSINTGYIPFSEQLQSDIIRPDFWRLINPFIDKIAYIDSVSLGDFDDGTYTVELKIIEGFIFPLPLMGGLALVIAMGNLKLDLSFSYQPDTLLEGNEQDGEVKRRFDAYLTFDLIKVRIPRDWLKPVLLDESGNYIVDENPDNFTEIIIPFGLYFNQDLDLQPLWPGGEITSLSLPISMLGNTGLMLGASNIFIDLSRETNITQADDDNRSADFVGFFVEEIIIGLPFFLQKDSSKSSRAIIKGFNLLIGTGGISGTIGLYALNSTIGSNDYLWKNIGGDNGFVK